MSEAFVLSLDEIVAASGGEVTVRGAATRWSGAGLDGRNARAGELYAAVLGERHDGHDFCEQAVAAGATGLLVMRGRTPRGCAVTCIEVDDTRVALGQLARAVRRRSQARVVGVTGSAGKTTTKELCAAALAGAAGSPAVLASEGSLNNETGVPLTLLRLRPQHRFAVVEMGMRGLGQIAYLRGFAEPDVGVVVNAGVAHVGVVGSPERIARGKSEIWLAGEARQARAVFPAADERLRALAIERGVPAERHVSFGEEPGASVRVVEVTPRGADGADVRFELAAGAGGAVVEARVPLPGRHNAVNAACALAVAHALGLDVAAAARGFRLARPAAHRSQVVSVGGRNLLDDCYNANPASMRAAVETLAELARAAGTKAVAVVGDMLELGDSAQAEHERLGRLLAERGVAQVALVGPWAAHVATGLRAAGGVTPVVTDDPAVAAARVAEWTAPGDWVLVKASRGMRLERVIEALRGILR